MQNFDTSRATTTPFRPEIAGLRAIAVVSVLIYHANASWLPGGFVGVDVFFVLSGYLISRLILKDIAANSFSITHFYARRIKRILPALIAVLTVVWIYGWFRLFPTHFRDLGRFQNISSFFYLNFMLVGDSDYFDVAAQSKPLLHLWSLSIEEQFYIFWPLLLLGIARFNRQVLPLLAVLTLSSFLFGLYKTTTAPIAAYYLPWTRSWELALGGLVAWREIASPAFGQPFLYKARLPLAAMGLALLLAGLVFIDQSQPFPGWRAAIPTLGTALILLVPANALSGAVLGNRAGIAIGAISYPLYLWHWPLLAFAHLEQGGQIETQVSLSLLALAVVLAILTHQFIEKPIETLYLRQARRTVGALFSGLVALGVLGIITHDLGGFPSRYSPDVARILDFPKSIAVAPQDNVITAPADAVDCFYNFRSGTDDAAWHRDNIEAFYANKPCFTALDPNKPTIALVGDSHAGHLMTGLRSVLGKRFNLLSFETFYCVPLIENVVEHTGRAGTGRCQAYNQFVFKTLRKLRPDIVLVGSYFWQYSFDNEWYYPNYVAELNKNAEALIKDGIGSVIIAGQVPTWSPSLKEVIAREVQEGGTPALYSMNGLNRAVFQVDETLKATAWADGVYYVSLVDGLCRSSGCRRLKGSAVPDDLMAVDYGHLSAGGSQFVVREILSGTINEALRRTNH
jgi:peptidoglycan/LPS O-acetylase OafA/YrhL